MPAWADGAKCRGTLMTAVTIKELNVWFGRSATAWTR